MEIQPFFSILLHLSIALKRWNFSYSFDSWLNFSSEVTFCQYKIIWQWNNKLNMEPLKKFAVYIMTCFTPFNFGTFCQFYSINSPVLFTKLHQETIEWDEKRRFFAYMAASSYQVISKEVENRIFRHNWFFRHICMYKEPTLTK